MKKADEVAPLVGAWIEIYFTTVWHNGKYVAPLVGAWIEIIIFGSCNTENESLLSWERGLKSSDTG